MAKNPLEKFSIDDLQKELEKRGQYAVYWTAEDIQELYKLSDVQANEVLAEVVSYRNHDANEGVNWEVLKYNVGRLFPDAEEVE
jgi:hypothetical protein